MYSVCSNQWTVWTFQLIKNSTVTLQWTHNPKGLYLLQGRTKNIVHISVTYCFIQSRNIHSGKYY